MRTIQSFLFASLMAAAVLGGCRTERYYCDDTGCFFCDGLGCRPVDAPDRPNCRGDFECADGTICTDAGCVAECAEDSDCPRGTACSNGQCLNPTEPPPTPLPGSCERTEDCGDATLICVDGFCQVDDRGCGDMGCDCSESGQCADGFICSEGECQPDEDVCQFNAECGADRICVDGSCRAECETAGECLAGQTCEDGTCVTPPPPTGECEDNMDCDSGEICVDSSCIAGCGSDTECDEGFYCYGGTCRVDDRPRPFCTVNSDCQSGRECVEGICRTPCSGSDADALCRSFDVQFVACRESYCVTQVEATSNCSTSVDCGPGRECVNGACD